MSWRTWAIDEEQVKADGYTWEEMFWKQARVPALLTSLLSATVYLYDPKLWWVLGGVVFILYSTLPALACYTHMGNT